MTKILFVNASPLAKNGTTHILQKAFLEGARKAGAEIQEVFLAKCDIKPCRGCFNCWIKTPGQCVIKDDQAELLQKCLWSDILVLGTPLYVDGMTAQCKTFVDRLIPLALPDFVIEEDHCRHPSRMERKWKFLLVSNCGFYEMDNFDALVFHCKRMCQNFHADYIGHILRPHGPIMHYSDMLVTEINKVIDAVIMAGEEVAKTGSLTQSSMQAVSAPIIPRTAYIEGVNVYWKQELAKINN
ncbi:MAG: flavodoxin family protein [Desulfomonilaceae bacterium]